MTIKASPNCSLLPWRAAVLAFVAVPKCIQSRQQEWCSCANCANSAPRATAQACPALAGLTFPSLGLPCLASDLVLFTQQNSCFLGLGVNFPKQTAWIVL